MVEALKPDFIAPVVGYLTSKDNETTSGDLFDVSGGWVGQTRWQRSGGHGFPTNKPYTIEDVCAKWSSITAFDDGRATHPSSTQEAFLQLLENFENKGDDIKAKL